MRSILIISVMNGAAWGGSEELWYHSALWLAKNSYKVGVCVYDWPGKKEKIEIMKRAGCELYLLPGKKETEIITGKWKLYKAFNKIPFNQYKDFIISQGGWKDILSFPFKNLYKTLPTYCLCFHNYDETERLSEKKLKLFQKWINKSTVNLAASKKVFETIYRNFNIDTPNQKTLINPISFYPAEQRPHYPPVNEKIIFMMLAALDVNRKAQDQLIRALANDRWKQRNWELHLYGEGPDQGKLENLILTHKLQGKVFLKGHTTAVKEAIASSHVVLQITHKDAMPVSVMEAMAMGRPVVASTIGDMPEWIQNEKNGWIVNTINADSIDATLELAWNNKDNWETMGENAFQTFKDRYPADPVKYFLHQCELI